MGCQDKSGGSIHHIEAGNFLRNHRERVGDVFLGDDHLPVVDAALCEDGGFLGDNVYKL